VFQTGSVQRNAFQLGGTSRASAAFQQGAFQGGAFQLYSGGASGTTPSSAFQQDAFQQGAFQMYGGTYRAPTDTRRPGRWHPDDAKRRRRPIRPIIYVDEDGNPVELGQKPAKIEPLARPLKPAKKADIPLDILASQLSNEVQALVAAYMRRLEDEYSRFIIIQQMEAIAAEEALNAALIRAIIKDVVARQMDDEEALFLMAAAT
jgi:hypothetical protein